MFRSSPFGAKSFSIQAFAAPGSRSLLQRASLKPAARSLASFTSWNSRFPAHCRSAWGNGLPLGPVSLIARSPETALSPFRAKFSLRGNKYFKDGKYQSPYEVTAPGGGWRGGWGGTFAFAKRKEEYGSDLLVYILMAINLAVFLAWNSYGTTSKGRRVMMQNFQASMRNLSEGRIWTLVTASVSQNEFAHFFFNMMGLYFVGPEMLYILGPRRFLSVYVLGAAASSALHIWYENNMAAKINKIPPKYYREIPAHGASGSMNALLVLYGCMFPTRIFYLYFFIPVPALLLVTGFVAWDLYSAAFRRNSRTAHAGHLGGALFGLLYFAMLRLRLIKRVRL